VQTTDPAEISNCGMPAAIRVLVYRKARFFEKTRPPGNTPDTLGDSLQVTSPPATLEVAEAHLRQQCPSSSSRGRHVHIEDATSEGFGDMTFECLLVEEPGERIK
jgi:hypothetical protein